MQTTYSFIREPRGEAYRSLLAFALQLCDTASLVVRANLGLGDAGRSFLASLGPLVQLTDEDTTEWPGTKLVSGSATLIRLSYDDTTREGLAEAVSGLYDWRQPTLPEDLALVRPNGDTFLGSISHERDGFLTLTAEELRALQRDAPAVAGLLAVDPG